MIGHTDWAVRPKYAGSTHLDQCYATTQLGARCRHDVGKDEWFCSRHSPSWPMTYTDLSGPQPFVYVIACEGLPKGPVKIGCSLDPKKRVYELQTASPHTLVLVWKGQTRHAFFVERLLHKQLEHKNRHREWFDMCPNDAVAAAERLLGSHP